MGQLTPPLAAWRVLNTDFQSGLTFLRAWGTWRQDPDRPRMLHYVALCENPCSPNDLRASSQANPLLASLAHELIPQWHGLLPGFHRFLLDQGQVVLTLCVGEPVTLLRAQQFEADAIELAARHIEHPHLTWLLKALGRCCRRGTAFTVRDAPHSSLSTLCSALVQSGFRLTPDDTSRGSSGPAQLEGQFDPPWTLKNTRQVAALTALPVARCAVIGAGLAGASVAAALARRGWQVRVLDQAGAPAAGASGLPVGLVVPHVSSDDCTLSRLSRAGVRLMLQQARALLELGIDWAPSGVLERQVGGTPKLPAGWPLAGRQWSEPCRSSEPNDPLGQGLWHAQGAWLKPTALVNAWLRQPGVIFQGHAQVAEVRRQNRHWELRDATGKLLYSAERVVFANACGAFALLQKMQLLTHDSRALWQHLPATQGMRGLLNWSTHTVTDEASFPRFPVNGSGSMVPNVPIDHGRAWYMGSSYQPETQIERSDLDNQARNFEHLAQLLPTLADQLAPAFSTSTLGTWKGTRCVTADRLPAVGPLEVTEQPGLWLCAGLGSRGMSFSVLCAELLAARFGAEPLPIEAKLARSLEAMRA